jgi:hypothetical protein
LIQLKEIEMSELAVIRLNDNRAFPLGAKPSAISYQWLDNLGDPVDMSVGTWTVQARAEAIQGAAEANLAGGSTAINTGTATATYVWHDDDFGAIGVFRMILWAGNGTVRHGSEVFEWEVADAPGDVPTV